MKKKFDTIILGGGISGLVAAYSASKKGERFLVLEASDRWGGVIHTVTKDEFRMEQGPNSILSNPELLQLIDELGIRDKVIQNASIADTRYLLYKDKPLKMKPGWAFFSSGFLNFKMVWAFLTERFRAKGKAEDESIAEFIRRRLNNDILNRMINPLVTGVYAGNPEELSLRATFKKLFAMEQAYGSLVKAMFRKPKSPKRRALSFAGGLHTLVESMVAHLGSNAMLNSKVTQVKKAEQGYALEVLIDGNLKQFEGAKIITALPVAATCQVLNFMPHTLKQKVLDIEYAPMMLGYLAYPTQNISHPMDGFGYLIPEQEHQPYLGAIWSSAIFPGVSPKGTSFFTLFVGGIRQKEALNHPQQALERAEQAFKRHMKINADALFKDHYIAPMAIPQFKIGYTKLMVELDAWLQTQPGITLSGNWRTGVAIGDCVAGNMK